MSTTSPGPKTSGRQIRKFFSLEAWRAGGRSAVKDQAIQSARWFDQSDQPTGGEIAQSSCHCRLLRFYIIRCRVKPQTLDLVRKLLSRRIVNYKQIAGQTQVSVASVAQYAKLWGRPGRAEEALARYRGIKNLVDRVGKSEAASQLGVSRQCVQFYMAKLDQQSRVGWKGRDGEKSAI